MGGTMRLGLLPGRSCSPARSWPRLYGRPRSTERHRHRYEVNNAYRAELEPAGLVISRHVAGRAAGRVRRAADRRCIRTSWPPRPIRSSSRRPTRAAPAVRRPGRGGAGSPARPPGSRSDARPWYRRSLTLARVIVLTRDELVDEPLGLAGDRRPASWPRRHIGTFVSDQVRTPRRRDDRHATYVEHPGAVGIIALDDDERVVLVRQYRHAGPAPAEEPPAGPARRRRRGPAADAARASWSRRPDLAAATVARAGRPVHLARLLRRAPRGSTWPAI